MSNKKSNEKPRKHSFDERPSHPPHPPPPPPPPPKRQSDRHLNSFVDFSAPLRLTGSDRFPSTTHWVFPPHAPPPPLPPHAHAISQANSDARALALAIHGKC